MASSDGDDVFPTEGPRDQAVSGPQDPLHITPIGGKSQGLPSLSCAPVYRQKAPVKVEFVSSLPAPGLKSSVLCVCGICYWCRSRVTGKLVMHHRTHSAWTTLSALRS